jgi:hypothetical protein
MSIKVSFVLFLLASVTNGRSLKPISASLAIDQALSALGGESALRDLKGITYHVPKYVKSLSARHKY